MDSADGCFGVAKITRKTALACLGRLCSLKGIRLKSGPPQLHDDSREDLLPIGQLIVLLPLILLTLLTNRSSSHAQSLSPFGMGTRLPLSPNLQVVSGLAPGR